MPGEAVGTWSLILEYQNANGLADAAEDLPRVPVQFQIDIVVVVVVVRHNRRRDYRHVLSRVFRSQADISTRQEPMRTMLILLECHRSFERITAIALRLCLLPS